MLNFIHFHSGSSEKAPVSETILRKRLPPDYLRSKSGAIEAASGTLYVSRPFRSGKDKKSKAVVSFVPRTSHFDISNERSGANEFRVCAP
jgi:sterol O-acyltransferase